MAARTPDSRPVHVLSPGDVWAALGSRPEGLSPDEAAARLARFGPNAIREVRGKPLVLRFLANFTHLMALLLWAGGLVGFLAGMPQLGIAIWSVNLINGIFSFWQEYRAEKAAEALRRLLPTHARVLRDGDERRVAADDLVPGDLLLLAEGDRISADARLVREEELRVDQSTLTGESHPARKTGDPVPGDGLSRAELPNLVFAGTSVVSGGGTAVVFATGMETEFGTIARLTQGVREERSPLQKEMARATWIVSALAVGAGLLFFGLAVLLAGMTLAEGFVFALGMIVAFVPEGMVPTVSLSLAMGVQRMARRKALVKRLSAVETLGCTSVICTDKTGTLTQNEMTVREIRLGGRRLGTAGVGYAPAGKIIEDGRSVDAADGDLRALLAAAGLCNNARLVPPDDRSRRWTVLGDPTEAALRVAAAKGGVDLAAEASRFPRLREIPFDSRRKRMTTVHGGPGGRVAYVKGAPGEVLRLARELPRDVVLAGNGTDPAVLEAAGIRRAAVAAAVTGADETNLVVTSLARFEFNVPRTIARVKNPRNAWMFTPGMGVDVALNQADLLAHLIAEEMSLGDMTTLLKLRKGRFSLVEEKVHPEARGAGMALRDLQLPEECVLVAILRKGQLLLPRGEIVLHPADEVLALVHASQAAGLAALPGRNR